MPGQSLEQGSRSYYHSVKYSRTSSGASGAAAGRFLSGCVWCVFQCARFTVPFFCPCDSSYSCNMCVAENLFFGCILGEALIQIVIPLWSWLETSDFGIYKSCPNGYSNWLSLQSVVCFFQICELRHSWKAGSILGIGPYYVWRRSRHMPDCAV